jgi:predicted nucleic acid-binding protein
VIVLDASAALTGLLNAGPARDLLASEQVHAPHLVDVEVTSALRRGALGGRFTPDAAWAALDTWRRLGITRYGHQGLLERAWALRENLSSYDATYVALAEALGCTLVTADRRLSFAPGLRCPVTVLPSS